ncbi:MAG TPA: PEP/pyruvate-binding domain-containing protein [Phycisphaerae bacterium]|nr:PEP/pyruvate-binding domain-containing protein [Phycisphaerae bacterium]
MTAPQWVYYFSDPPPAGCDDPRALLGGKGASLKELSRAGLNVPPGFTITTECCRRYFAAGRAWPEGLEEQVRQHLARLEAETGRTFGRGERPLLVSVRSGAAVSMPGMMDTILNCGLTPALADDVGDAPAFWRPYLDFVLMFAKTVHGIGQSDFEADIGDRLGAHAGRELADACLEAYARRTGADFPTTPSDALTQCINAVFDSWQNDRAVAYRKRYDVRGLSGTAVNVQMMFPSEVSGIVFTQDPNDLRAERMIVEASYGLGESVVSGDVTPDRFLVARGDLSVQAEIGHKHRYVAALGARTDFDPDAACLSDDQLRELAELSLRIERHFGHPVDIEFGWADGRLALLQSRRIRGLEIVEEMELAREEEIFRLRAAVDGPRRCWVVHNLAETLPAPTPLTWDVTRAFMSGSGGFGRLYRQLGYRPSERVCREGFLELICGRIYADPDRLAELFWDAFPLRYDVRELLADPTLIDRAPARFDPNRADGRFLARLPGTLAAMFTASRKMKRARADAKRRFEDEALPPYLQYVQQKREQDLAPLSDEQVLAELNDRRRRVLDEFGPESLRPGFFGGVAFDALEATLRQLGGPDRGGELARTLTRALAGDTTFHQDALLCDIAAGSATMDGFLAEYGHRCVGEMELSVPRWREDPSYLEATVQRMRAAPAGRTPADLHRENLALRVEAEEALPATLREWGGGSFRERIERDLADAQALLPYREAGKHYLMMGYELVRRAIEQLAERWGLDGRTYFLRADELGDFAAGTDRPRLIEAAEKRRIRWQAFQRLELADVIDSEHLQTLGLAPELEAADELTGAAVASGSGTGTARVVFDANHPGELGANYVLVCPSTDPGWTPLFTCATALVVERGGVLSHGAIVARDFGIPAVVCANATRLIASGDRIRVDGNTGRIFILERQADRAPVVG